MNAKQSCYGEYKLNQKGLKYCKFRTILTVFFLHSILPMQVMIFQCSDQ